MATDDKVDVKVGDKVRVTYEGPVSSVTEHSFGINDGRYFFSYPDKPGSGRTVEIVERAKPKPKVGDEVFNAEYEALPIGAILRNPDHYEEPDPIVKTKIGWTVPSTGKTFGSRYFSDPRTVVYLPE